MRAPIALGIALGALLAPALARAQDKEDAEEDGEAGEDDSIVVDDGAPKAKPKRQEFKKQDLTGHAVEASSAKNLFEKDRFFVDKVDTKKTAQGTLVQGSLASSSFLYTESSGQFDPVLPALGTSGSRFNRLFTELRLQTDFRHIGGGAWDARIDTRARLVNSPKPESTPMGATETHVQSGFNGTNEYDVREAWLVRSGKRSDLFFGRQFIPDLGALRIDGLRIDYAQSEKLTLIMFGGLYPVRGSRSLTTDYKPLLDDNGKKAGRLVGSGGFGVAYRTLNAHGSLGGVTIAPLSSEIPRVYAISNGYYRGGAKIDLYHSVIADVFGKAAPALTNLSAGVNYKPAQRLRVTGSFNRVDTETLNVQANAFLGQTDATIAANRIQNETYLKRLSTNAAKLGVSAGLGSLQRFEISTSVNYRYRGKVTLSAPDGMTAQPLEASKGADVVVGVVDRRSIAKLRLGADLTRSFTAFQRSELLGVRAFAAREFKNGRGEWEVEVSYSTTKDVPDGTTCTAMTVDQCVGTSNGKIFSVGGNLYFRINADWFALGNLFLSSYGVTPTPPAGMPTKADPTILGLTGFARVAYRF